MPAQMAPSRFISSLQCTLAYNICALSRTAENFFECCTLLEASLQAAAKVFTGALLWDFFQV